MTYDEYLKLHTEQGHHPDGACPRCLWASTELDQASKDTLVRILTTRDEQIKKARQRQAEIIGEIW